MIVRYLEYIVALARERHFARAAAARAAAGIDCLDIQQRRTQDSLPTLLVAGYQCLHLVRIHRLGEVKIKAGRERAALVLVLRPAGERDRMLWATS
jgi:hypothetical protein